MRSPKSTWILKVSSIDLLQSVGMVCVPPGLEREEHLDSEHDEEESEDVEIEKERFSCGPG